MPAYAKEEHYVPWVRILTTLSKFYGVFEGAADAADFEGAADQLFATFKGFVTLMIDPIFKKIGFDKKETDGHLDSQLREMLVSAQARFLSTEEPVRAEATRRYNAWREDASTPLCPPSIRTSIFHIVAENGGEEVFDQLKQIHDEAHDDVVKKAVFQSIGWLPTKALKVAALEWASFSGEVKLQDFQYVIYTVATSNNDGGKTTWDWYEANFMRLREKLASNDSNFARLAGTVLAGIGTQEELDHAKELKKHSLEIFG